MRALADPQAKSRISAAASISGTGGPWKTEKALSELTRFDGTRQDMERYVELLGIDPEDAEYVDRRLAWAWEPGHYETMLAAHLQVPDVIPRSGPVSRDRFPESLRGVGPPALLIAGRDDDLLLTEWMRHLADELTAAAGNGDANGPHPERVPS